MEKQKGGKKNLHYMKGLIWTKEIISIELSNSIIYLNVTCLIIKNKTQMKY